jgi:hypothetical protein
MTIGQYIYDRLIASTNITAISSCNIFPNLIDYKYIPGIEYTIISQTINSLFRRATVSIKGFEKTQALCETFNNAIYALFDPTTSRIYELKGDMKIESVYMLTNIPSVWDNENKLWFCNSDIRINYIK